MKKRVFSVVLIFLTVFLSGCEKATVEGFSLYRSTPLGFSMEYPSFWEKTADVKEGIAAFVTPQEGFGDEYRENVSVQRFTPETPSLEDYSKKYLENLEGTLKNYKLVSEEDTELAGEPAYKIVYESQDDDETASMRFLQIFALHGGNIYVLSYMADFNGYAYFLSFAEKMIATFRFLS